MGRYLTGIAVALAVVGVAPLAGAADGATTVPPFDLDRIRHVYENQQLGDKEIVALLAKELDQRLTVYKKAATSEDDRVPDICMLVNLLGHAHNWQTTTAAQRAASVEAVMQDIAAKATPVENRDELLKYVKIATALAGGKVASEDLVGLLDDKAIPRIVDCLVLDGLTKTGMPVSMLPRLVSCLEDPTNYVAASCVGTVHARRVYPMRASACAGLQALGIACTEGEKLAVSADEPAEQVFQLDPKSVAEHLRAWIKDQDVKRAREAIKAAGQLKFDAVRAMLGELAQDPQLGEAARAQIKGLK